MPRRSKAKREKRQRPDVWDPAMETKTFRLTETKNELLERYYASQPWLPADVCSEMFEAYRRELPLAFRLTGGKQSSETVKRILKQRYFSNLEGLQLEPETNSAPIQLPTEIPWYPDGLAYQMSVPRKVVRKSPMLNSFHNFLVTENESGTLSRQEAVSMIPPLFMDIQPGNKILDMCAAPGSKTAQLIEILENVSERKTPGKEPDGLIIANDSDNRRCYLLVHQALKRHGTSACAVTNHDAGVFPNIVMKEPVSNEKNEVSNSQNGIPSGPLEILKYDRILCDVPCSGDGTLRKNLDIWSNWKIQNAHNLHILQARIAKRGIDLLAVGGRMVYSTCSLNPVENEATLIQLLEYANGAVELVDVSNELPELKRLPGISDWKVMDKIGNFVEKYDDIEKKERGPMPPGIFPNPELAKKHHLERAFRILPQYQDTGGFFVAVLTKTRELTSDVKVQDTGGQEPKSPPKKKLKVVKSDRRGRGYREDPFIYPNAEELAKVAEPLADYFGISDDFPFEQLLYRCEPETGGKNRNFYFTNKLLTNVLRNNDLDKLHVINGGVRIFHRIDPTVGGFRLAQDGFKLVAPFMSKRVFRVSNEDAVKILNCEKFVALEDLREDFRQKLEETGEGTVGLRCFETEEIGEKSEISLNKNVISGEKPDLKPEMPGFATSPYLSVDFIAFRGKSTIAPYVAKEMRLHLLRLLGYDTTTLEEAVVSNRRARQAKKNGTAKVSEKISGGGSEEVGEKNSGESDKVAVENDGAECEAEQFLVEDGKEKS